jgi:hypothetical protein
MGRWRNKPAGTTVHPVKPLHGWARYNRMLGYVGVGSDAAKQAAKLAKKRTK